MNWITTQDGISGKLKFENQTALAQFVLELAKVSDRLEHHADMSISYNELVLNIYTHDEQSITEKDYQLRREIEKLLS